MSHNYLFTLKSWKTFQWLYWLQLPSYICISILVAIHNDASPEFQYCSCQFLCSLILLQCSSDPRQITLTGCDQIKRSVAYHLTLATFKKYLTFEVNKVKINCINTPPRKLCFHVNSWIWLAYFIAENTGDFNW